mmetsp:Transcript_13032/g.37881  ORF Transcript_13032/g.37881 Transcript_13032/m.37881 type:complete len:228 (-) Transcript_13032:276-959(-)
MHGAVSTVRWGQGWPHQVEATGRECKALKLLAVKWFCDKSRGRFANSLRPQGTAVHQQIAAARRWHHGRYLLAGNARAVPWFGRWSNACAPRCHGGRHGRRPHFGTQIPARTPRSGGTASGRYRHRCEPVPPTARGPSLSQSAASTRSVTSMPETGQRVPIAPPREARQQNAHRCLTWGPPGAGNVSAVCSQLPVRKARAAQTISTGSGTVMLRSLQDVEPNDSANV